MRRKSKRKMEYNKTKTKCYRGHEFTEENTHYHKRGNYIARICKACRKERSLKDYYTGRTRKKTAYTGEPYQRKKPVLKMVGEKNPMWAGDKVGYAALHKYITHRLPKPELCQRCNQTFPLELSSNGVYDRDTKNWEWICHKCHIVKDGLAARMAKMNKARGKVRQLEKLLSAITND